MKKLFICVGLVRELAPSFYANGLYGRRRAMSAKQIKKVFMLLLTLCPLRSYNCEPGQALIGAALIICLGA